MLYLFAISLRLSDVIWLFSDWQESIVVEDFAV